MSSSHINYVVGKTFFFVENKQQLCHYYDLKALLRSSNRISFTAFGGITNNCKLANQVANLGLIVLIVLLLGLCLIIIHQKK